MTTNLIDRSREIQRIEKLHTIELNLLIQRKIPTISSHKVDKTYFVNIQIKAFIAQTQELHISTRIENVFTIDDMILERTFGINFKRMILVSITFDNFRILSNSC